MWLYTWFASMHWICITNWTIPMKTQRISFESVSKIFYEMLLYDSFTSKHWFTIISTCTMLIDRFIHMESWPSWACLFFPSIFIYCLNEKIHISQFWLTLNRKGPNTKGCHIGQSFSYSIFLKRIWFCHLFT